MSAAPFKCGDPVRVRRAFPPGHVRAPFFLRGSSGIIDEILGSFGDPEKLAYGQRDAEPLTLYRVKFKQTDVWDDYQGPAGDTLVVDVYENWLEATDV